MVVLVLGGGASGKSEFAEQSLLDLAKLNKRYYLATMIAYGESGQYRVNRHRTLRQGKGFETLEIPVDIVQALDQIGLSAAAESSLLLEDLSNLLANEMYDDMAMHKKDSPEDFVDYIMTGICQLKDHCKDLVIVSNNIFEDGCDYDPSTRQYIEFLGQLNCRIAKLADKVVEVVVGIPVEIKDACN